MPARAGDSSATGSRWGRSAPLVSKPRRWRRRRTRVSIIASTMPISLSVGGGRGRKRRGAPAPSMKTPSRTSVWKWTLRLSPPPNRWMTVTHPDRPSLPPLPHGHTRQHAVDEAGGVLGHAPTTAARAEAATLARERHEPLEGAIAAPKAGEAQPQHAAREKVPKLLFHKLRQARPVGVMRRRVEEGIEVLVDHAVQHAVLDVAWPIVHGAEGHRQHIGSARRRGQCPEMDTPQALWWGGKWTLHARQILPSRLAGVTRFRVRQTHRRSERGLERPRAMVHYPQNHQSPDS